MSATKPKALNKFIAKLYVAPYGTIDTSDMAVLKADTGWTRLPSIRGAKNTIEVDTQNIKSDDNGTILSIMKPEIQVLATFLESSDAGTMDILLPGTRTTDAGVSEKFILTKKSQEVPRLTVKLHAVDPEDETNVHVICLTDCILNGTYSQSFLDVAESGDVEGSDLVFDLNDGGDYIDYNEII